MAFFPLVEVERWGINFSQFYTEPFSGRNKLLKMAAYASQVVNKRQKTMRDVGRNYDFNEFFSGISRIEYKPDSSIDETLCFRHYNSRERVHGRTMEEWLRPSVSFSPYFFSSGHVVPTAGGFQKHLEEETHSQENYKKQIRAAFEFYHKLGVKFWSYEDIGISFKGSTWDEMSKNMDDIANLILELQSHTGIKPLWVTCNFFHTRFRHGGFTNPDANIVASAAAYVKKMLEFAHRVGAECFLVRDIHEGYNSILNTDMSRELRHYSRLLKITADYKDQLNYKGQLLFQPHLKNDIYSLFDYSYVPNAPAALCLLRQYGLERHYKLDLTPYDEIFLTSAYGMLGSLEVTHPYDYCDVSHLTLLMKNIIEQGGIQPGGLNVQILNSKGVIDIKDVFAAYINVIDRFAFCFLKASKLISDGLFAKNLQQQYLSFHTGFGNRLMSGEADLEDCEENIRGQSQDFVVIPGQSEYWQAIFTHYMCNKNL